MDHNTAVRTNLLIFAGFMVFIAVFALNFGTDTGITGAAVGDCEVECYADSECDDGEESTRDICLYAGECSSKCINN